MDKSRINKEFLKMPNSQEHNKEHFCDIYKPSHIIIIISISS